MSAREHYTVTHTYNVKLVRASQSRAFPMHIYSLNRNQKRARKKEVKELFVRAIYRHNSDHEKKKRAPEPTHIGEIECMRWLCQSGHETKTNAAQWQSHERVRRGAVIGIRVRCPEYNSEYKLKLWFSSLLETESDRLPLPKPESMWVCVCNDPQRVHFFFLRCFTAKILMCQSVNLNVCSSMSSIG